MNFDLLTYAGNRANAAQLESEPPHTLVQDDIYDPEPMAALMRAPGLCGNKHGATGKHWTRRIPHDFASCTS